MTELEFTPILKDPLAVVDTIIAQDRQFFSGKRLESFTERARGPAMPQDAGQGPNSYQNLHFVSQITCCCNTYYNSFCSL